MKLLEAICIIYSIFAIKSYQISEGSICDRSAITVSWPNGTIECLPCPNCRRGWGSTYSCGDYIKAPLTKPIGCVKCDKRQTFSPRRSTGTCQRCTQCLPNHKVEKKCTRSADRRCGGCEKGYYKYLDPRTPIFTTCEKCSSCCGDLKDKRIKECEKQGLPRNSQCSFLQNERCNKTKLKENTSDQGPFLTSSTLAVSKILHLSNKSTKITDQRSLKRVYSKAPATQPSNSNDQLTSENSNVIQLKLKVKNINTNSSISTPGIVAICVVFAALVLAVAIVYLGYRRCKKPMNSQYELSRQEPINEEIRVDTEGERQSNAPSEDVSMDVAEQPAADTIDTGVAGEEQQAIAARGSRPVGEFISDNNSRYIEFCSLINNDRLPRYVQDFDTILHGFGITEPTTIDAIRNSLHGAAQSLLQYLHCSMDPPVTLEQIARQLDSVGRKPTSKLLREEDARLQEHALRAK